MQEYMKLMKIAEEHLQIAQENAVRKAVQIQAAKGVAPTQMGIPQPGNPQQPSTPAPQTPAGQTQAQSQAVTQAAPQPPQVSQ
jgi:hypothetical protein